MKSKIPILLVVEVEHESENSLPFIRESIQDALGLPRVDARWVTGNYNREKYEYKLKSAEFNLLPISE